MDNETMVEAFKYLNYCQLAVNSLVSKKFCNLIRTHRHSLALLYVNYVQIERIYHLGGDIKIFTKQLSSEAYNEWVIRNQYSKQVPLEDQVVQRQSSDYYHLAYALCAAADYNYLNLQQCNTAFSACAVLNNEYWPLFEHFVRLLSDPFIYIRSVELIPQKELLKMVEGAINPNRERLRCEQLIMDLDDNFQLFINWMKGHVLCNQFWIKYSTPTNYDEELLDLFITGAQCTSEMFMRSYEFSNVVGGIVQKFMHLKDCDESHFVPSIEGKRAGRAVELLKHDFKAVELLVKEDDYSTKHVFEFINNDIGKKLQFNATFDITDDCDSYFWLNIKDL